MQTIKITNYWTGAVILETEAETLAAAVTQAAKNGANLRGADLYGANLRGANLYGANLYGADLRGADLQGADMRGANLYGANLRGADLYGADLRGADLRGTDLPAPTMMLLAFWGEVSGALCRDLMVYDASCHPVPTAFDRWARGGNCPYSGVKVERAALFQEQRALWDAAAPLCRPYDLMQRLLEEKCPVWTDDQLAAFEAKFKKVQP